MGKYLICSRFCLCFYMKILLGNKALVLRSISVSEIGPNVAHKSQDGRVCSAVCSSLHIQWPPEAENINKFIVQL